MRGSGSGIRTHDLRVMSPTSYRCSIPHRRRGGQVAKARLGGARGCAAQSAEQIKPSAISTTQLHPLPGFHLSPIKPVVFRWPYPLYGGGSAHLEVGFALRCFQRFSCPDMATRRWGSAPQPAHQRSVHPGPLVLGAVPRNAPAPAEDRDRTVSRRSEPSSRAALMGEQPNPWDRLQPQDATSRHRGAKPCRRCELSGKISLLSPG